MFDKGNTYLYHYTTFENAVRIVSSRQLRFSAIDKLNDINESSGSIVIPRDSDDEKELEKYLKYYLQLSFTIDKKHRRGFNIPAMWGHYASKGSGVCLFFDKDVVCREIEDEGLYGKIVRYDNDVNPYEIEYHREYHGDAWTYIEKTKDQLFFQKSTDWEYEQEFRVIAIDKNIKPFSISNSLKGVILFNKEHNKFLNSEEYQVLNKVAVGLEFYRYTSALGHWDLFDVQGKSIRPPLSFSFSGVTVSEDE